MFDMRNEELKTGINGAYYQNFYEYVISQKPTPYAWWLSFVIIGCSEDSNSLFRIRPYTLCIL